MQQSPAGHPSTEKPQARLLAPGAPGIAMWCNNNPVLEGDRSPSALLMQRKCMVVKVAQGPPPYMSKN